MGRWLIRGEGGGKRLDKQTQQARRCFEKVNNALTRTAGGGDYDDGGDVDGDENKILARDREGAIIFHIYIASTSHEPLRVVIAEIIIEKCSYISMNTLASRYNGSWRRRRRNTPQREHGQALRSYGDVSSAGEGV